MSFDTFCRECSHHFADQSHKSQHVEAFHYGLTPPNPAIPERVFYALHANVPAVRAKTCPVCFIYFKDLANCVRHVADKHPTCRLRTFHAPTKETIILEWKHLVEVIYPGALQTINPTRDHRHDESCSSDYDDLEFYDVPE